MSSTPARPPSIHDVESRVAALEDEQFRCIGSIKQLRDTVGEEVSEERKASGLVKAVMELKETVGQEPSAIHKTDGTGMARMVHEVHAWMREERERVAKDEQKPAAFLRRLQTAATVIGLVISTATVLSGCAAAATWFTRMAVQNTGGIITGKAP